ncbi:unnamed protein product, partial [Phaeothamnion confervicola]
IVVVTFHPLHKDSSHAAAAAVDLAAQVEGEEATPPPTPATTFAPTSSSFDMTPVPTPAIEAPQPTKVPNKSRVEYCLQKGCNGGMAAVAMAWDDAKAKLLMGCLEDAQANKTAAAACFGPPTDLAGKILDLYNCGGCSDCFPAAVNATVCNAIPKAGYGGQAGVYAPPAGGVAGGSYGGDYGHWAGGGGGAAAPGAAAPQPTAGWSDWTHWMPAVATPEPTPELTPKPTSAATSATTPDAA